MAAPRHPLLRRLWIPAAPPPLGHTGEPWPPRHPPIDIPFQTRLTNALDATNLSTTSRPTLFPAKTFSEVSRRVSVKPMRFNEPPLYYCSNRDFRGFGGSSPKVFAGWDLTQRAESVDFCLGLRTAGGGDLELGIRSSPKETLFVTILSFLKVVSRCEATPC
jgi:hypothetical protein